MKMKLQDNFPLNKSPQNITLLHLNINLAEEDQSISLSALPSLVMTSSNNQVQYTSKETNANMKESALLECYSPKIY
jgi:hypothetical protein